ncbi:hypothetical protein BCE75_1067 [Isoptericola sp. CG 20/1183]|uniref:Uncharacterized protein n=1 Tax=Isoptericola halotolerans TaxID=300560 RepID=A0ABX5EDX9_9MICO|nr:MULTISPECIES: DUF6716 putative glycosyltransferase [Isoptericola]PRZ06552.1 hypothetical protein BCL65_106227 [Isoptericola halotolerans]PRZ06642.1 hypothetical protein BCE75_1067 [Isoptericola sp. CG 20/1183]
MTVRVLAVADSDSYLKWAAWSLARLRDDGGTPALEPAAVVVRSPLAPTPEQSAAAVASTGLPVPPVLSPGALARLVRARRPDVVLVAATGPVAELVARRVQRATRSGRRPALVTGLPGMALPATQHGTGWRRWADAFVVHGRHEAEPYRTAFARHGAAPLVLLSRLPFLDVPSAPTDHAPRPDAPHRVVLAAQAKVPTTRDERVRLLDGLARLADDGFEVTVKLRARTGERQTHNEPYPLDALWTAEHQRLGRSGGEVGFAVGPMSDHLTPGTALLTVSSTAGLESLARGLPTVFLTDFGVGPEQLNEAYVGSGCLAALDEVAAILRAGGPTPEPGWCEAGYLHRGDELGPAVRALAERARAGTLEPRTAVVPWSWPRYLWSTTRSALPVTLSARLTR